MLCELTLLGLTFPDFILRDFTLHELAFLEFTLCESSLQFTSHCE